MRSDFSETCKAARAALDTPPAPLDFIHREMERRTRRPRKTALLVIAFITAATVAAAAAMVSAFHLSLVQSGNVLKVSTGDHLSGKAPVEGSDLPTFAAQMGFPVIFPAFGTGTELFSVFFLSETKPQSMFVSYIVPDVGGTYKNVAVFLSSRQAAAPSISGVVSSHKFDGAGVYIPVGKNARALSWTVQDERMTIVSSLPSSILDKVVKKTRGLTPSASLAATIPMTGEFIIEGPVSIRAARIAYAHRPPGVHSSIVASSYIQKIATTLQATPGTGNIFIDNPHFRALRGGRSFSPGWTRSGKFSTYRPYAEALVKVENAAGGGADVMSVVSDEQHWRMWAVWPNGRVREYRVNPQAMAIEPVKG
jgi:hypothetical protein